MTPFMYEDDPPCTSCQDTGWNGQSERYCDCEEGRRAKAAAQHDAAIDAILEAARAAKDFLINDQDEPGRTVFWKLENALKKMEHRA